jgi:hypothetical protein
MATRFLASPNPAELERMLEKEHTLDGERLLDGGRAGHGLREGERSVCSAPPALVSRQA